MEESIQELKEGISEKEKENEKYEKLLHEKSLEVFI